MTHAELIEYARKWLTGSRKCSIVTTELVAGCTETPDAIGWRGTLSTLVEAKTSVSDFMADKNKFPRKCPEWGIGKQRYYIVDEALVEKVKDKLLDGWGLIYVKNNKVYREKESGLFKDYNSSAEIGLLTSIIKRIAGTRNPLHGVSVRCYVIDNIENPKATLWVKKEQKL